MNDLANLLTEIVVPKPGMVLKDKRTGEYAKVDFFQWRDGETSKIPVSYDSGKKEQVWITQFARHYEVIDPASEDYLKHRKRVENETKMKELLSQAVELTGNISDLKRSMSEIPRHQTTLRSQIQVSIGRLDAERVSLMREVQILRKEIE